MNKLKTILLTSTFALSIFSACLFVQMSDRVSAIGVGGPGNQITERFDIIQLRNGRSLQVKEPSSETYTTAIEFESVDDIENTIIISAANSTTYPYISVTGTSANMPLVVKGKGNYGLRTQSVENAIGVQVGLLDSSVATVGDQEVNSPYLGISGSIWDTNFNTAMNRNWKMQVVPFSSTTDSFFLNNNDGLPMLIVNQDGGAVFTGSANVGTFLYVHDNQILGESASTGAFQAMSFVPVDNQVNYVRLTGSASASGPVTYGVSGQDADIDLMLEAKGIGNVLVNSMFAPDAGMLAMFTDVATTTASVKSSASGSFIGVSQTATDAVTITITSSFIAEDGAYIRIKDTGSNASINNITIETEGAETIDGAGTYTINSDLGAVNLVSDGGSLFVY